MLPGLASAEPLFQVRSEVRPNETTIGAATQPEEPSLDKLEHRVLLCHF